MFLAFAFPPRNCFNGLELLGDHLTFAHVYALLPCSADGAEARSCQQPAFSMLPVKESEVTSDLSKGRWGYFCFEK